jgi:hypothetical protein
MKELANLGIDRAALIAALAAAECSALAILPRFGAVFAHPPQPLLRINGKPGIGLAIAIRDGWARILSARSRRVDRDAAPRSRAVALRAAIPRVDSPTLSKGVTSAVSTSVGAEGNGQVHEGQTPRLLAFRMSQMRTPTG